MTLDEVRQVLKRRLRRPDLWRTFALAAGAWMAVQVWLWAIVPPRSVPNLLEEMLLQLPAVSAFNITLLWLSPVPWQWDGRPGLNPVTGRRLLTGFLGAELMAVLLVAMEDGLGRAKGEPGFGLRTYIYNLGFQGPLIFLAGNLFASRERLEGEREELRKRTDSAMAEHLKGQVHPHVLFNTLNGLAELMHQDPDAAEGLVEAMSGFLQRVLDASQSPAWPLSEERSLAEDFLRMEATRLGDRLSVAWDWDPALDAEPVLPLVLQPLVENAVKHGVNPSDTGGEIRISVRAEAGELRLEVLNSGAPVPAPSPSARRGTGLANLRRRLELAYEGEAAFGLVPEAGGWTAARIRVKLGAKPRL